MLSNSPTKPHAGQRQHHRRQNSTPSAPFDTVKVPTLQSAAQRRAAGHRRGMSLDIRRQHAASANIRQDYVDLQIFRSIMYCEKRSSNAFKHARAPSTTSTLTPNYLTAAVTAIWCLPMAPPMLKDSIHHASTLDQFHLTPTTFMQNQASFGQNMNVSKDFELFTTDSALSTPTFMNFAESPSAPGWISEGETSSTRRSSRRISNGIMDRVSKFENLGLDNVSRPITPPHADANNTPHDRMCKQEPVPNRFTEGYDESLEETIKPVRARSNLGAQSIFQDMRQEAEQQPEQPSSAKSTTFPVSQMQGPMYPANEFSEEEFLNMQASFDGLVSGPIIGGQQSVHSSTPSTPHRAQFSASFDNSAQLSSLQSTPHSHAPSQSPVHRNSSHRRTESLASIASAASIASINIEETKTETGVTTDDIAQYICGPDLNDGKWTCVYEGCGKKFGRKENIKSHVQTHLNDRQYQCPTCKKCFVRQHDLKRHAKIHTGIKPYPCECGNSFARHDALTRHRQRGMCIGAFDGIVRKVVKRGRPKKHRPDMEERTTKSARQRRKNLSVSSVSSQSGYTDSSAANSPDNDLDMLDDMLDLGIDSQPQQMASSSSALMPSVTSQMPHDVMSSPSVDTPHSYVSPEAIMEKIHSRAVSPSKSVASTYNTPPELSQSSSPPPARLCDFEANTSCGADDVAALTASSSILSSASLDGTLPLPFGDQDSNILLSFSHDEGIVPLDRDPNMMMLSKFDDEFGSTSDMFVDNDDLFFGTS
uniref:pH-response transcription factor pacC/RIM101 n=2 Tax=Bionectria ochroleuca TaxID=29856 RepID=A0A0B7JP44_BIOOC